MSVLLVIPFDIRELSPGAAKNTWRVPVYSIPHNDSAAGDKRGQGDFSRARSLCREDRGINFLCTALVIRY